jgi:hypothetical protein
MKEQVPVSQTNRREMLKLSTLGVLGGVAAGAIIPQKAQAVVADPTPQIAYASWIHGHSMRIEFPDQIVSQRPLGFYLHLEGAPGTTNWFHFAIPTPVIINDVRLRPSAVILSFQTGSSDALVRDIHVYDGTGRIAEYKDVNLSGTNWFKRFDILTRPEIWQGLGISIGVTFGAAALDHTMQFASAGCDFTTRPPVDETIK